MQDQVRSPLEQSMLFGLVAGAIVVIALKLLTGLALTPLAIVFVLVFAIAAIFRLRVIRMTAAASRNGGASRH